jgi:hypothetical protein
MTASANNYTSIEDIQAQGEHLGVIADIISGMGLTLLTIAPEIAVHCDPEVARSVASFSSETLKPVVENLIGQIRELETQWLAAKAEADALEAQLQGSVDGA